MKEPEPVNCGTCGTMPESQWFDRGMKVRVRCFNEKGCGNTGPKKPSERAAVRAWNALQCESPGGEVSE